MNHMKFAICARNGLQGVDTPFSEPESHVSPQCDKKYRYKQGMDFHLKNECGKEPSFQCPHCPHRAKRMANIKRHIASIHKISRSWHISHRSWIPLMSTMWQNVSL
ncbi:longitudinals lacking protein, isoforms A/B/D/L isoform X2 [Nilaparvata lugens]|uniref:longitudinals lacking protein, isoforms A/B/D/L isoform X2 n=1 Tax=Nilaparvata lugens TaxID=108931 RepID=UPI00193CFF67|nr:longitudinals lacking protein, isoforms A/B/D/L isoform X2 [Nilaparvata lugens]